MKPKLLSWNVRGLNEAEKHLRVKNLLKRQRADIRSLQESKLEFVSNSAVHSLRECRHLGWCDKTGGIFIMWDWSDGEN